MFLSCRENESPSRSNLEKEIPMLEIGVPIRNTVLTTPPAPENPVTAQTPESTESQSTPTQQPPLATRYAHSIISFHLRLPDCAYINIISGAFLDILEKTQGQKNSRISKNSRDFSKNSRIFSKNSSFCQLLNFEIAAKKKLFFRGLYRAIAD